MYGAAVQVRYHDARAVPVGEEQQEVLQFLRTERLPLPAVFLNGQLLYSGKIDPLTIVADVARAWRRRG